MTMMMMAVMMDDVVVNKLEFVPFCIWLLDVFKTTFEFEVEFGELSFIISIRL